MCLYSIQDTKVKLMYGKTKYMGAVAIYLQDTYEVIQDIENDKTAAMICRELGYNFTRLYDTKTYSHKKYH